MKTTDVLFRKTLARVGPDQMRGVINLVDEGHTGIAEKHTVSKLFAYVENLESRLGIEISEPDKSSVPEGMIKISQNGISYFAPSASGA